MKGINKILSLLIIVVIGTLLFLCRQNKNTSVTNQKNTAENLEASLNAIYKSFHEAVIAYVIKDEGTKLKPMIIKDQSLQTHHLKDVLKEHMLIFRFSANDCDMCFKSVVSSILKIINTKDLNKVAIIFDSYDDREFMIRAKHLNLPFNVYKIEESFGLHIENKNLPFLFMVSKNMTVEKLFIPYKEIPNATEAYLSHIQTFF